MHAAKRETLVRKHNASGGKGTLAPHSNDDLPLIVRASPQAVGNGAGKLMRLEESTDKGLIEDNRAR